ncbi:MAG TPA: DUF1501 domain-containing protein [Planctomycetota bacterium]|nr:DUF1501 domain-containing protein [Planctomycetota bacterium]
MTKQPPSLHSLTRRHFVGASSLGIGAMALAALFDRDARGDDAKRTDPLAPKAPHFAAKAKRVVYLNMTGGPSQLDLFDYKPVLKENDQKPIPPSAVKGIRFSGMTNLAAANVLASPWEFKQHGPNGTWLSELLPGLAGILDEVALVKSMRTDEINHVPAQLLFMTGSPRMGRPVMGSWVTFGLGSECENLPGYVVLSSGIADRCGTACWSSGFLPSVYQGVQMRGSGDPVLYLSNPGGIDEKLRRKSLDTLNELNTSSLQEFNDPEIATRIASYEMAYKMQASVPELMDISKEPKEMHALYGTEPGKSSFANNCLLARRLLERGVRFVQLNHAPWDHHGSSPGENLALDLPKVSRACDGPSAALVKDLKARGLLDSTLVIWGGEFGRSPILQGKFSKERLGRDHLGSAYTLWLAGGGVKRGLELGKTDDFGLSVVEDPVHVHDMQATILHLLGMDHTKLTYRFQGRDYRLTDVHGEVVKKMLA